MKLIKSIGRLFGTKGDPQIIDTPDKLAQALGAGYESDSGQRVTTTSAMQQLVVFNCVRVLAESIGMLPCRLLKQTGKVRLPATAHRLFPLLSMAPNGYMTAQEFWEMLVACLCLRGNFFAYKVVALGNVVELLPINPDMVKAKLKDDWTVEYTVTFKTGVRVLTQDEIWHVRLFTLDGLNGLNPIAYARQALGLGQAMNAHAAKLFTNGAVASGVLSTSEQLTDAAFDRLKTQFQGEHMGVENLATIGPRGLRYRIITTGIGTISVERLTSNGDIDEDWPGFSLQETIHGRIELDSSNLEGGYRGSFAACPEGELVTEIEWDVFFTGGLIGNGKKGDQYAVTSGHQFEYRDMATSGAWTVLPQSISGNSMDAQGFTFHETLPYPMRPECRIKRMPKVGGVNSGEVMDDVMWYGLRGKMMGAPTRYEDMTVIAVRVRNGDRLSAQSESLVSVEATRVLPVRSGGAWVGEAPTRDIVPWFLYIAKSAGYVDADLDLAELDRLHAIYQARGDTFDMTIDDATTVKEAMNDALAAGFSELTINRGLLLPVRDEPRSQFEHMYTPQNMTKGLKRQLVFPSPDDFDGVDVEYFSSITWAWETVECRWLGDLGNKVEKVKVPGISDRTRAWRIGMRRRGHQKYRSDAYKWETELDALNSSYLSYVAAADDVPGYGQSSILLSVESIPSGIVLESTEPFDWSAGGVHVIALRRQDGSLSGPWPATYVDEYRVRVNSLDFAPDTNWDPEPPHLLFGPVNRWSYPTLVTVVNPSGGGNVTVEGMPYDSRVYLYDNSAPA